MAHQYRCSVKGAHSCPYGTYDHEPEKAEVPAVPTEEDRRYETHVRELRIRVCRLIEYWPNLPPGWPHLPPYTE